MEQAYRRLVKELKDSGLVKKLSHNYYEIKIHWNTGIKERLVLRRRENNGYKIYKYLRSRYRPRFMPPAKWWDDLYSEYKINHDFMYVNELLDEEKTYSNLVRWKWCDYQKANFYERLLLHQQIILYITENGWNHNGYPSHVLSNSLKLLLNEKPSRYYKEKPKLSFKLTNFGGKERPGAKLLQHFIPHGLYGQFEPVYMFNMQKIRNKRRVYNSINCIIRHNIKREKRGRKQFTDFTYETIFKHMTKPRSSARVRPQKIRQIGLYRAMIQRFELSGHSMFDIDPIMGEMALAAHLEECPYYFRPSCPFDVSAKEMSEFLNTEFNEDIDGHYDFTIFDNSMVYKEELYFAAMDIFSEKVDTAIIFVNNQNMDSFTSRFQPHEEYQMRCHNLEHLNGKWLVFHF